MSEDSVQVQPQPPAAAPAEAAAASKKRDNLVPSMVAEGAGVVGSVVAGWLQTMRLIAERAYKNISSTYLVEDIKKLRPETGSKLRKIMDSPDFSRQQKYDALQKEIHNYESMMDQRHLQAGVRGPFKEFGLLRTHQKMEVILSGIATTGIALSMTLGAVMLLSRNKFSQEDRDTLEKLAEKDAEKNQAIQR